MRKTKALLLAALLHPNFGPATRAIDYRHDNPKNLVPSSDQIEMNLRTIDSTSQRSVKPRFIPWSDVGWKANKGLIAERIYDPRFQQAPGWRGKHEFLREYNPSWMMNQRTRDQWVASLSPAEKYDLVLGIVDGGLADHIGDFLDDALGRGGAFPSWWGLCEGAAASSVYYPEPVRPVMLHSEAYNVDVPFYAPDIKGLATMLWSRFNTALNLPEAGLQCKPGGEGCFDSNPAVFHAAVHHFLDLHPGILVGDMDPTPVVWNFPLVAYSERYYRPDRGEEAPAASLDAAAVPVGAWADPRARSRAPGTASIVGVRMTISYAVNQPKNPPYQGSLKRRINSRVLSYELELDANGQLIGGEWVKGAHPDLLWTIPPGTAPDSVGDRLLPEFSGNLPGNVIPSSWATAARSSANQMTPLRRVVEILVKQAAESGGLY